MKSLIFLSKNNINLTFLWWYKPISTITNFTFLSIWRNPKRPLHVSFPLGPRNPTFADPSTKPGGSNSNRARRAFLSGPSSEKRSVSNQVRAESSDRSGTPSSLRLPVRTSQGRGLVSDDSRYRWIGARASRLRQSVDSLEIGGLWNDISWSVSV